MKFKIQYNNEELCGTIPDSWEEYTVKHFTTIEANSNDIQILSALSGISEEAIQNTGANLDLIMQHVASIFNTKPPDFSAAKKGEIKIEGKEIKFPRSLDFTRYGQKSLLKNILQNEKALEKEVARIFAIYAQPLIDGKFDSTRIDDIKKIVEDLPIIKVYPYVLFFFKKSNALRRHLKAQSMQYLQP